MFETLRKYYIYLIVILSLFSNYFEVVRNDDGNVFAQIAVELKQLKPSCTQVRMCPSFEIDS